MSKIVSHMPGYAVHEYMLVLNLPEALRQRVVSIRQEFSSKYKTSTAFGGKPFLPMVRFNTWAMMEEKIVQRLKFIGMGFVPFKIQLKDYGSFPSHTIYINVTSKIPIQNLIKELRTVQRLMKVPDHDPHFIPDPRLTIAGKLLPWQYEKGWLEYSNRHFTASFIADGMLLLKKRTGETRYQVVQKFEFMNLPVSTKQGELF